MNQPRVRVSRHPATILAIAAIAIVVAFPVLAASPAPSGAPAASGAALEPEASKAPKEPKGPKASKEPAVPVTVRGTVSATTDEKGRPAFTIAADGKTLKLDAGPPWFFKTNHPLQPFVGKTVTIVGEQRGDEVDVTSVDGTLLRAPGKPPWAGGWKRVGKDHPGWTQEKADRWAAKLRARADCATAGLSFGQCKKQQKAAEPAETPGVG